MREDGRTTCAGEAAVQQAAGIVAFRQDSNKPNTPGEAGRVPLSAIYFCAMVRAAINTITPTARRIEQRLDRRSYEVGRIETDVNGFAGAMLDEPR